MEADRYTVTVPKHYSFIPSLGVGGEKRLNAESNYDITIVDTSCGDFEVTGAEDDVSSFVDDICIGDEESVDDIMKSLR